MAARCVVVGCKRKLPAATAVMCAECYSYTVPEERNELVDSWGTTKYGQTLARLAATVRRRSGDPEAAKAGG